jgi:predicted acyltransferase
VSTKPTSAERLLSIDALRGFDMFWIIGGDTLIVLLLGLTGWSMAPALQDQFEHVEWEGFRFYDLIFPLFLFLVGCVLPFSLDKNRAASSNSDSRLTKRAAHLRIARRTLMLILLGLICNRLLDFNFGELRIAGVLQRIGICYGFAALVYLHSRLPTQVAIFLAILIGYWGLITWIPAPSPSDSPLVPGTLALAYSKSGNLAGYIDRQFLPGKILAQYYGNGDNEGILSTIPAVATVLLGVFAGTWLRSRASNAWKVAGLVLVGTLCLAAGYGWGRYFPIIKNIWTSSFVLVAGGWSLLLLGLFFTVIDVFHWRRVGFVWVVIGANAITIYVAQRFIDFRYMTEFFLKGLGSVFHEYQPIIFAAGIVLAKWLFLWFLYRQRLFLRA